MERLGCTKFPWAHNAVQDEEAAPAANYPNNSLYTYVADEELRAILEANNDPLRDGCADQGDGTPGNCPLSSSADSRSRKTGVEIGAAVVGYACGRVLTVVAGEGNSVVVIHDITDIAQPTVFEVIHLNPSGETKVLVWRTTKAPLAKWTLWRFIF